MVRLFLAVWLVAFVVQSTDLLATIIPDDCIEDTRGSAGDPCPENCARCVCCARVPVFVPQAFASAPFGGLVAADLLPPTDSPASPFPRGIFHVPKTL